MDFNPNSLLASLALGTVGLAVFMYGKRQGRFPHMLVGVGLMVFPYFVSNVLVMAAIATALMAALWGAVRLGA